MMNLQDILLNPSHRYTVIRDCVTLIDQEVANKSGLGGMAIKTGYKVVKKLKHGKMIEEAVDWLLDDFVHKLEQPFDEFIANTGESFDNSLLITYFTQNQQSIAHRLLEVTDEKAHNANNQILKKTYSKLRPMAQKEVERALPGIARIITAYK